MTSDKAITFTWPLWANITSLKYEISYWIILVCFIKLQTTVSYATVLITTVIGVCFLFTGLLND